jgi:hypothetical protein
MNICLRQDRPSPQCSFVMVIVAVAVLFLVFPRAVVASSRLSCHYCYRADVREDCYINQVVCEPDHVCFVEENTVTYNVTFSLSGGGDGKRRRRRRGEFHVYRMGCVHHGMCRDATVSGPSLDGYAVTTTSCCCHDLCQTPDGIGAGKIEHCKTLWGNYTMANAATAHRKCDYFSSFCCLLWSAVVITLAFML